MKQILEVKESLEKIDSELVELWSRKETLEAEKETIIKENPIEVLKIDLGIISRTLEVFNTLNGNDYSSFSDAEDSLNFLYHDIAIKIEKLEEEAPVNAVEEETVEAS